MSLIQTGQVSNHGRIFNNLYVSKKKISSGSFGVVYLGQNVRTKELCAIKVEKSAVDELLSLERETQILKQLQNVPQIPKLYWFGQEGNSNVMVMQVLGYDLTHYLKTYRKFSLKCVLNIADQMLTVLESIHKRSVLHRDIKPENILTGRDSESQLLYLVDYGISKFYKDTKGQHIPFKENKPFIGTTRYAPIAAHMGQELSRKDDLESLGYMLIFLLKGQLPWQQIQTSSEDEKIKLVGAMKMRIDTNELCKDLPVEFVRYMDFVRKLGYKAQPDYKYLQQLFKKLQLNSQFTITDRKFDWVEIPQQTHKSQENFMKRPKRQSSADPSSLLIHQVDSSNLMNRITRRNEAEVSSQGAQGPSSYLRLPDQRQSVASSLLMIDSRNADRHKSMSTFKSFGSSFGPDNSVMVGFQPSVLGSMMNNSHASSRNSKNSKKPSTISAMDISQFHQNLKRPKDRFIKEVSTDSAFLQDLPEMRHSIQMSIAAQRDLNIDEEIDLVKKMQSLIYKSVQSNYKNPLTFKSN